MIIENEVKKKIKEGKPVVGTFLRFTDLAVVKIAALAGMEFFIIDNEHIIYNDEAIQNIDIDPIIRCNNQE